MNAPTKGSGVERESPVLFQPIVDAQSRCIVSCAWVPARPHLPAASQDGPHVMELEDWNAALTCLQAWRKQGFKLSLLAPLSQQQLYSPTFVAQVMRLLEERQIPVFCIELEIAEHIVGGETDIMVGRLWALRESGFSIVIDQLGSGYSSVAQWRNCAATAVRIDEALTRQPQARDSAVLIEAILMVSTTCGLRTIAAGVQDADAAAVLTLLGVHRLQGNFFGQPMDGQSFTQRLRDARTVSP